VISLFVCFVCLFVCLLVCLLLSSAQSVETFVTHFLCTHTLYRHLIIIFLIVIFKYCINCLFVCLFFNVLYTEKIKFLLSLIFFLFLFLHSAVTLP